MPIACPGNLHETGKELQGKRNTATTMTALLSADVQTYAVWTVIPKRSGKGGTKHTSNGPKVWKVWPKEPKERPKVGTKQGENNTIGSQLI
jgi:hypothetical protein